jgi:hypothetical protein
MRAPHVFGWFCPERRLVSLSPFKLPNLLMLSSSHYPASKDPNSTVLISAHYDSRGSFGSTRAPGANDDGSGTVALLSIARTIKRRGIKFRSAVEFCAFAGEEQGLYGSRARARECPQLSSWSLSTLIMRDA